MDKRRLTALIVGISCLAALGFAAAGCNSDSSATPSPSDSSAAASPAAPAASTAASPAASPS